MRKVWGLEEMGYLPENVGLQEVSTTAKNMNNYYESIKVKKWIKLHA